MKVCCNCQKDLFQKNNESPSHYLARKFCDRSCAASFNNRKSPKCKKKEKEPFKIQVCKCCQTEFQVRLALSQNRYTKREFCDPCVRAKRLEGRQFNIEDIALRTKGDLFSSRKNWQSARTAIRVHAEKIINKSRKDKICSVCQYSIHVEICHVIPVSEFPESSTLSDINSQDNLIYLCPNHHWEFDNGLLKLKAEHRS